MLAMGPKFVLQTSECLALVVQEVDRPIYPINQNPLDNYYQHSSAIHFIGICFLFHLRKISIQETTETYNITLGW